jgi:hypothetical protein
VKAIQALHSSVSSWPYQTGLERLARDKNSGLLWKSKNYGCKKLYRWLKKETQWRSFVKAIKALDYRVGSWPYQTRLERLARDKNSGLLLKYINYTHKRLYRIGPRWLKKET